MLICLLYFALLLLPRLCRCRAVAMSPSQQGKATRCSRVLSLASSELPLKAAVLRAWASWHHGAPRQVSLGGLQNAAEASVQSPLAPCSGFGVRSNGLGRKSMVWETGARLQWELSFCHGLFLQPWVNPSVSSHLVLLPAQWGRQHNPTPGVL